MSVRQLLPYGLLGMVFGALLIQAEVVSWFRIQEMFRFHAFHMYGIIATAIVTASIGLMAIRRLGLRDAGGSPLALPPKAVGSGVRYLAGGTLFGIGWALTGACPGPLVALVGAGTPVLLITLASALAGTWTYGLLRQRLPH
jgi:uncharacterized membrane protein YedE/YeeE